MITSEMTLEFVTVDHIRSQKDNQISKSLNKAMNLYGRGGLIIHVILMNMEFKKVAEILGNVEVNISEAREHVGEVDRKIRNVKDHGI